MQGNGVRKGGPRGGRPGFLGGLLWAWCLLMGPGLWAQVVMQGMPEGELAARLRQADSLRAVAVAQGDEALLAEALQERGSAYWMSGQADSSFAISQRLLRLYERQGNVPMQVQLWHDLGLSAPDSALHYFDQAFATWQASGLPADSLLPTTRFEIARQLLPRMRYYEAYLILEGADVPYTPGQGYPSFYLHLPWLKSILMLQLGDTLQAVEHTMELARRVERTGEKVEYLHKSNFLDLPPEALPPLDSVTYYYDYYFRLSAELGPELTSPIALLNLSRNHWQGGYDSLALHYLRRAEALLPPREQVHPWMVAQLAALYLNRGDTAGAVPYVEFLDSAVQAGLAVPPEVSEYLYPYYLAQGDTARAFVYYQAQAENNLAEVRARNRAEYDRARLARAFEQEREAMAEQASTQRRRLLVGAALLLMGILAAALVYRYRQLRQQERQQRELLEAQLKALRAQMNPHFLFNALASIQRYVLQHNTEEANHYLTRFSRFIRRVLHDSERQVLTLEEELEGLQQYLDLERMRLEGRLEYQITVEEGIDLRAHELPGMVLHTFAENAIWHGLSPQEAPGWVRVEVMHHPQGLRISLEDTGIGREAARARDRRTQHQSKGLQMVHDKLNVFNLSQRQQARFYLEDLRTPEGHARGTRAVLELTYPTRAT